MPRALRYVWAAAAAAAVLRCSAFGATEDEAVGPEEGGAGEAAALPDGAAAVDGAAAESGDCTLLLSDDFGPSSPGYLPTTANGGGLSTTDRLRAIAPRNADPEAVVRAYVTKTFAVPQGSRSLRLSYSLNASFNFGSGSPGCRLLIRHTGDPLIYKLTYEDPALYHDFDLESGGGIAKAILVDTARPAFIVNPMKLELRFAQDGATATVTLGPRPPVDYGPMPNVGTPTVVDLTCGVFAYASVTPDAGLTVEIDDLRFEACR